MEIKEQKEKISPKVEPVKQETVKTETPKVEKPKIETPAPTTTKKPHAGAIRNDTTEMSKIIEMLKQLPVKSCSKKQYTEVLRILPTKIQR